MLEGHEVSFRRLQAAVLQLQALFRRIRAFRKDSEPGYPTLPATFGASEVLSHQSYKVLTTGRMELAGLIFLQASIHTYYTIPRKVGRSKSTISHAPFNNHLKRLAATDLLGGAGASARCQPRKACWRARTDAQTPPRRRPCSDGAAASSKLTIPYASSACMS
jgi:hypothetical protein